MATLERAIQIAVSAHAGQIDKSGQPYVLHPLRVMFSVSSLQERIAAMLHDVIEDTSTTMDDLMEEGFHEEVIEAVRALTKLDGESRMDVFISLLVSFDPQLDQLIRIFCSDYMQLKHTIAPLLRLSS